MSVDREDVRSPTDSETACFEAGIKFGSLYHQFAGTPLTPESADSLARAIEASIENQPYCESVSVDIDELAVADAIEHEHGYTELTGTLMDVDLSIVYEGNRIRAAMRTEAGYPRMRVRSIEAVDR